MSRKYVPWVPPRAETKYEIWVPPSRNARYTPWAPPNGARGFVPWNPANPTIPIGLPTQPFHQSSEVWHWLPTATVQLRAYPPWYTGFVKTSNIMVTASREPAVHSSYGLYSPVQFDFMPPSVGRPIESTRLITHIGVASATSNRMTTTIKIGKQISYEEAMSRPFDPDDTIAVQARRSLERMPADIALYFDTDTLTSHKTSLLIDCHENVNWLNCPTRDDFSDISLTNLDTYGIRIRHLTIVLNNQFILDRSYDIVLLPQQSLSLKDDIAAYRRFSVQRRLNGFWSPQISLPPVLEVASQEIGKCYDVKYLPGWRCPGNERDYWIHRPNSFCTEFSSWAIRQATSLEPPQLANEDIEGNLVLEDMVDFFHIDLNGKWLGVPRGGSARDATVAYERLGDLVKPGDYCCELVPPGHGSGGHSMFFIGWCDVAGNPCSFNPNPPPLNPGPNGDPTRCYNYFWSVSGNWSMVNQVAMFSISDSTFLTTVDANNNPIGHIRWLHECNGFGMMP